MQNYTVHQICTGTAVRLNLSRLPEGWWDSISPDPDATGMSGICHDIIGTDGLAFAPDVQEVRCQCFEFLIKVAP